MLYLLCGLFPLPICSDFLSLFRLIFVLMSSLSGMTCKDTASWFQVLFARQAVFHYFHFSLCIFACEVYFSQTANIWVLLFTLLPESVSSNWRVETIYIQRYYRKVCPNVCPSVAFLIFTSFLSLNRLSKLLLCVRIL